MTLYADQSLLFLNLILPSICRKYKFIRFLKNITNHTQMLSIKYLFRKRKSYLKHNCFQIVMQPQIIENTRALLALIPLSFAFSVIHFVIHALPSSLFSMHTLKNHQKISGKKEGKQTFFVNKQNQLLQNHQFCKGKQKTAILL